MDNGANVNAPDNCLRTALIYASSNGYLHIVPVRLYSLAHSEMRRNVLSCHCFKDYTSCHYGPEVSLILTYGVKMLLKKGANIDAADCEGETALMAAASWGYSSVAQELIKKGNELKITHHFLAFIVYHLFIADSDDS